MRNAAILTILFMVSLVPIGSAQSKIDTVIIKTRIFCDHCKACETCGEMMERDLYLTHGIKNSTFNPADTTITVVYKNTKTNAEAIRRNVAKMGYDADHIPASPKGYEKLDSCCKLDLKNRPEE